MNGYFDHLEAELRAAVPRSADAGPASGPVRSRRRPRWRRPRWRRPRLSTITAGLGVVITLAVAVTAIALLGHRAPTRGHRSSPSAPAAASPLPTLAQLKANFAILRRPQTAADRSWRPDYGSNGPREVTGLERLARRMPGGRRAFLTVQHAAGDRYLLRIWAVDRGGDATAADFSAADEWTSYPLPSSATRDTATRWTSVVPDGVKKVIWTFGCRARRPRCRTIKRSVMPADNVVTAEVPGTSSCSDGTCRQPAAIEWLSGDGAGIVWTGQRLSAPPFFHSSSELGRLRPLPLAPGALGLGHIAFGTPYRQAQRALVARLGPAQLADQPTSNCAVDHQSDWTVRVVQGRAPWVTDVSLQFGRGRFVGYSIGGTPLPPWRGRAVANVTVATANGLRLHDTVARAHRLYGAALHTSAAQGGSYWITTPHGRIDGYAFGHARPGHIIGSRSTIRTIQAGDNGCPAQSP